MTTNYKFAVYTAGIFCCYFYFGILQEKITKGKYVIKEVNENGEIKETTEPFTYVLSLVCAMCLVSYIFAKGLLMFWHQKEDTTAKHYLASSALTYLLAMISSNMALQWVSYPTQVIGKSGKPIPVMLLGVLVGKRSYPAKKYLFVLLIVIGIVIFMYKDKATASREPSLGLGLGELLLVLSLLMDGLTGAIQERMRSESSSTGQQMMAGTNMFATLYLFLALAATGEGVEFVRFASRHPVVIYYFVVVSVTAALGQLFIYSMVSDFGPLPCSIVTTTRKFATVLASVILFGNVLTPRQWIGAIIVFSGLFLDAFYSKRAPKKKFDYLHVGLSDEQNRKNK